MSGTITSTKGRENVAKFVSFGGLIAVILSVNLFVMFVDALMRVEPDFSYFYVGSVHFLAIVLLVREIKGRGNE